MVGQRREARVGGTVAGPLAGLSGGRRPAVAARGRPARLCLSLLLAAGARAAAGTSEARFSVSASHPHRETCFTEGFFVNGTSQEVFESCGLYERSYLRRYALATGETLQVGHVPKDVFSEGIAQLGSSIYMLTYQKRQVLEYDARTFRINRRHPFPYGEGWGLTTDGCDLLATTGSKFIYRLRLDGSGTLALVSKVEVTHDGAPVDKLNEMEYVTPKLWINVWQTNTIYRVDPLTGVCEFKLSVGGLHTWQGEATPNGIAYSTAIDPNMLLVTGKLWPQMFRLKLSSEELCGEVAGEATPQTCALAPPSACWSGSTSSSTGAQGTGESSAPEEAAAPAVSQPEAGAAAVAAALARDGGAASAQAQQGGSAAALQGSLMEAAAVALAPPAPFARPRALPVLATAGLTGLALLLAASAAAIPCRLWTRRRDYRLARQQCDQPSSV